MAYFFSSARTKTNIRKLFKFLSILVIMFIVYGVLFHYIMEYEGRGDEFSWLTGFYWTLVTMTTLGFGDIVFSSDLGRAFSMVVLFSGVLYLLVMLPFTFIEFFYAPWLRAQNQARAPRELPESTRDHVIITNFDAVTAALIKKLKTYDIEYVVLEEDLQTALDMSDEGYNMVLGSVDDLETYRKLRVKNCSLVAATGTDMSNTNVAFTVREYSDHPRVVCTANSADSIDILKMAGANQVIQLGDMLGRSLARRTLGGNARVHVIGHLDKVVIGEATVQETPIIGKTIEESGLREKIGVNIVGIWERGNFILPKPDIELKNETVLVLAGTVEQLRRYDEVLSIYHVSDHPVIIIGSGRVGRGAAKALSERGINYRIVEKDPGRVPLDDDTFILGDAADINTLKKAGIDNAHSVLVTTNQDDINIYLTIYCRQLNPDMQIISRATYEKNINTLHRAGADFVMSYASMGANIFYNSIEKGEVLMIAEGLNVFDQKVGEKLAGKSLIDSNIRQITGCSVIAVIGEGEVDVNPAPSKNLKKGEELILIGKTEGEQKFNEYFSG
ncbi:MAG TPA: NAD-binding protein [Balneolaceae bacterium]|nr:NAD-binding protein [Balneolaceae bacterium]